MSREEVLTEGNGSPQGSAKMPSRLPPYQSPLAWAHTMSFSLLNCHMHDAGTHR